MRAVIVVKIMLFISLMLIQADASGCFPCRKRKAKANIFATVLSVLAAEKMAATSTRQSEGEATTSTTPQVQLVEAAIETRKEEELEEEMRQHERKNAVQILARVLNNMSERPRPHRTNFYGYCAIVHWT